MMLGEHYDIRPLREDDLPKLVQVHARSMSLPVENFNRARMRAHFDPICSRGVWHSGKMVGGMVASSRRMRVPSGSWVPVMGISWLAILPEHQRRGVVHSLSREVEAAGLATGKVLAGLIARRQDAYDRWDVGVATYSLRAAFSGRLNIPRPVETIRLESSRLEPGHLRDLASMNSRRAGEAGHFDVSEEDLAEWLDPSVVMNGDSPPEVTFAMDDAGVAMGYAVHQRRHASDPEQRLWVLDVVALSPAALGTLWRHLARAGAGAPVVTPPLAGDDPVLSWIRDYCNRRVVVTAGLQLVLLDLPRALETRGYAADLDPITIETKGRTGEIRQVTLQVKDGTAAATLSAGERPAVRCGPKELAAVYLGQRRWSELVRAGLVHTDAATARCLDDAFATSRPPRPPWDF